MATTNSTVVRTSIQEVWRSTGRLGFEVSNLGRMRTYWVTGKTYLREVPRVMKLRYTGPKYVQVNMRGEVKQVHVLVLEAFVGPRPVVPGVKIEARHLNDVKYDNRVDNLAWGTQMENVADARKHDLYAIGERRPNAIATDKQAIEMRELYSTGKYLLREIAEHMGLPYGTVRAICSGDEYKHLPMGRKSTRLRVREFADEVYKRVLAGECKKKLAKEFGVGLHMIYGICYKRGHKFSRERI